MWGIDSKQMQHDIQRLGHSGTGVKLMATLVHELKRQKAQTQACTDTYWARWDGSDSHKQRISIRYLESDSWKRNYTLWIEGRRPSQNSELSQGRLEDFNKSHQTIFLHCGNRIAFGIWSAPRSGFDSRARSAMGF